MELQGLKEWVREPIYTKHLKMLLFSYCVGLNLQDSTT